MTKSRVIKVINEQIASGGFVVRKICPICNGKGEIVTDDWFSQIKVCPKCKGERYD